jgi:Swt1-like HEPN
MTNKTLRDALTAKLGVSRQRINQRARALKLYVPMSTEDATYCLAHQQGFALEEYLPPETVDRIRKLLSALGSNGDDQLRRRSALRGTAKARELVLAGGTRLPDPILPEGILDDASKMATTAYPMFYVFENSVRFVVATMMANKFGEDWWHKAEIKNSLKKKAGKGEGKDAPNWRSARVSHPIYSTDINDLIKIVKNNWTVFRKLFPRPNWFADRVSELEMLRNTLSHMNPLLKRDMDRLRADLSEWWEFIRANRAVLNLKNGRE